MDPDGGTGRQMPGTGSHTRYPSGSDLFRHWTDANGDCQDTRAEVLITESRVTPRYTTTRQCAVLSGRWISPYDGAVWTLASDVDIDHRVALKEAWESGGSPTTWVSGSPSLRSPTT